MSIDNENLASQKISMEWSRIEEKNKIKSASSNYVIINILFILIDAKRFCGRVLRSFLKSKTYREKINKIDREEMDLKLSRLHDILGGAEIKLNYIGRDSLFLSRKS